MHGVVCMWILCLRYNKWPSGKCLNVFFSAMLSFYPLRWFQTNLKCTTPCHPGWRVTFIFFFSIHFRTKKKLAGFFSLNFISFALSQFFSPLIPFIVDLYFYRNIFFNIRWNETQMQLVRNAIHSEWIFCWVFFPFVLLFVLTSFREMVPLTSEMTMCADVSDPNEYFRMSSHAHDLLSTER